MQATVLVENNSNCDDLLTEHGVSFLIEADGKKVIFDVGATDLFLKNAKNLSMDLSGVDQVILSHGHYDHIGGLEYIKNKKVYVHPDIFIPKYHMNNDLYEYSGFSQSKGHYKSINGLEFIEIRKTLSLTSNIKLHVDFKKPAPNDFYLKVDEEYVPDLFVDELVLSVNTPSGLVIVTGCAHSGIINIIDKVISDSGSEDIYALLGGFHLYDLDQEETKNIAKEISQYNISKIGISHCTGDNLAQYLPGSEVFDFNVGSQFIC